MAAEDLGPEPPRPGRGRGETVLLVEDDAGVQRLARESLVRDGYQVLEARAPFLPKPFSPWSLGQKVGEVLASLNRDVR